jgi:hypothetical protein
MMTVAELIECLRTMPQDSLVFAGYGQNYEVRNVVHWQTIEGPSHTILETIKPSECTDYVKPTRKQITELSERWVVHIEGNNLDLINPSLRYVLREMLKLINEALPEET